MFLRLKAERSGLQLAFSGLPHDVFRSKSTILEQTLDSAQFPCLLTALITLPKDLIVTRVHTPIVVSFPQIFQIAEEFMSFSNQSSNKFLRTFLDTLCSQFWLRTQALVLKI